MRVIAKAAIFIGALSTIYGVFPVLFVYPFKPWNHGIDFINFIFLQARERFFWQMGLMLFIVGLILLYKSKWLPSKR